MDRGRACWRRGGVWTEGTPQEYFLSDHAVNGGVVALVGGGGKTSLMYHLAEACRTRGMRTVVMTSTRIYRPEAFCSTAEECRRAWAAGQYAVCGQAAEEGKLASPPDEVYRWLLRESDILLVEADGAKRRPCKAPADHEPVLPRECTAVIGVMGMDALDRSVEDACLRCRQVCQLLGCGADHLLTEEDMAEILLSPRGTGKDVGARAYHIVLNQCDDALRLERGKIIAALLESRGHVQTVLTRLK